jgi:hypothetical protein
MQCLESSSYFEKLDDVLSPEDNSGASENCDGTYSLSESILQVSGFERDDLSDTAFSSNCNNSIPSQCFNPRAHVVTARFSTMWQRKAASKPSIGGAERLASLQR